MDVSVFEVDGWPRFNGFTDFLDLRILKICKSVESWSKFNKPLRTDSIAIRNRNQIHATRQRSNIDLI